MAAERLDRRHRPLTSTRNDYAMTRQQQAARVLPAAGRAWLCRAQSRARVEAVYVALHAQCHGW